ncbi:MAG: methyltransferase [Saprospiraceae bacterium]|nr:methyltransferase [Saprospiraceae bacterium]
MTNLFRFKKFDLIQEKSALKVGTDAVILGAWTDADNATNVLDIGTGTGVIALMIAQKNENCHIDAIDIDEDSAIEAQLNFKNSRFSHRLKAYHSSVQSFCKDETHNYDLIVSNPPFFNKSLLSEMQRKDNARHTLMLTHEELLICVKQLLAKEGKFCVVLPPLEGMQMIEIGATLGLYCSKETQILSAYNKPVVRLLLQFEKKVKPVLKNSIILYEKADTHMRKRTKAYTDLTSDFYLDEFN